MKRKKHIKKIAINTTEYYKKDFESLYQFVMRFKEININRKPPVRYKHLKGFFDYVRNTSEKFLYQFENDYKVPVSRGPISNEIYFKYWCVKKAYICTDFFRLNKKRAAKIEANLDRLMYFSTIIESHRLYEIRNKIKNAQCFDIEFFLKGNNKYPLYFNSGISSIFNIKEYSYPMELIENAVYNKYTPELKKYKRVFYIHSGKTNSGKTYNSIEMLKKAEYGTYLSPLRLLALEVSDNLNSQGIPCSFVTGEEEIFVEGATHIASTVELADFKTEYDVAVIDECQMIADASRGHCWTKAIMNIKAKEICLCTAPEAVEILTKLIDSCGDYYEIINHRRTTPLVTEEKPFDFDDIKPGDALVAFSKDKVNAIGAELINRGVNVSVLYGALPYVARKQQFENFINGKSTVLVTTDAIGMGVNLPVRRIVFMEIYKFDGRISRLLNSSEVKQIAGRAGRRGKFDTGYVTAKGEKELEYIRKRLTEKTAKIKGVCIGFPKGILNDSYINLKTALEAWEMYSVKEPYIKENISESQELLKPIMKIYKELDIPEDKTDIFDMASMPVDARNPKIKSLYLDYVEQRLSGYDTLRKPYCRKSDTDSLITYTKMLDTYFMCCRSWNLRIDNHWLREQRHKCNEALLTGLIGNIEKNTRYCKLCGNIIEWDNKNMYCYSCCEKNI